MPRSQEFAKRHFISPQVFESFYFEDLPIQLLHFFAFYFFRRQFFFGKLVKALFGISSTIPPIMLRVDGPVKATSLIFLITLSLSICRRSPS